MKNIYGNSKLRISCLTRGFISCSTFCLFLLTLTCCSNEKDKKIEELTKKVDELTKTNNNHNNLVVMQLQKKCSNETERFFRKEYGKKELSGYVNHYNRKMNKCFILISSPEVASKTIYETLYDHFENKEYGSFYSSIDGRQNVICNMLGTHCKSYDEWQSLVKPYMEE